jgi:hypothetical protein
VVEISPARGYAHGANGQRAYKQVGGDTTEYFFVNGQPIAERTASGDWSDYFCDGSRRLARADNYEDRLVISGTNCSGFVYREKSKGKRRQTPVR